MKKLVLVICTLLCANVLFAQENITKEKDLEAVVDSLSAKLNKLQNDYDYLYCLSQLKDLIHDLTDDANNLNNRNNELKISIYHERFNYDLYSAMKQNRNASVDKYNSTKEMAASLKMNIGIIMLTSNFNENQLNVLKGCMNVVDHALNSVESALELYKLYLEEYYKKW